MQNTPDPALWDRLTPKEKEVFRLIVKGSNGPAIAEQMDIAIGTVRSHLTAMFNKMEVKSQTELVTKILRIKLDDAA